MTDSETTGSRASLISALTKLANAIEADPPEIIGSDIFVQSGPGGSATGLSISMARSPGGASAVGQRISVFGQPGQSVTGQRITVVSGGDSVQAPPHGTNSKEDITKIVDQLRDAAKVLESSSASQEWIQGVLKKVSGWGSAALTGAISGATNAATKFYLTDS